MQFSVMAFQSGSCGLLNEPGSAFLCPMIATSRSNATFYAFGSLIITTLMTFDGCSSIKCDF